MSRQQQILSFATKKNKFYKVAGRGLIRGNHLNEKFKKMTLGTGAPAREKIGFFEDLDMVINQYITAKKLKNGDFLFSLMSDKKETLAEPNFQQR